MKPVLGRTCMPCLNTSRSFASEEETVEFVFALASASAEKFTVFKRFNGDQRHSGSFRFAAAQRCPNEDAGCIHQESDSMDMWRGGHRNHHGIRM